MPTCSNCQHTWTTSKPKRAAVSSASASDLAQLTDRQLYEHYKRTAPVADTLFFAEHCSIPHIRHQALALAAQAEQGLQWTEVYRRLVRLQDEWRVHGRPPADEDRLWHIVRRFEARERAQRYRKATRSAGLAPTECVRVHTTKSLFANTELVRRRHD